MTRKTQACFPRIHLLIILILLILVFNIPTGAQGQNETAHVEAHFDHSSKSADVEPGGDANGIVINTGYVIVTNQTEPEIHVNLNVSAGGWGAAITPSSSTEGYYWHNMGEKHPFQITVRVPPGTSHKVSQNVVVGGTWHGNVTSGNVDPTACIIFIEQYIKLIPEYERKVTVEAGERFSIPITIWNMGNDEDETLVEIGNRKSLERKGWSFDRIPKLCIYEKGAVDVEIRGRAPYADDVVELEIMMGGGSRRFPLYHAFTITVEVRRDWTPFIIGAGALVIIGSVVAVSWVRSHKRRKG